MKERLQCLLSEVGESFDYLKSDIRNLSRYMAELEDLLEHYRSFASNATLTTQIDRVSRRKLLKKTKKVIGPTPDKPKDVHKPDDQESERAAPDHDTWAGVLMPCRE